MRLRHEARQAHLPRTQEAEHGASHGGGQQCRRHGGVARALRAAATELRIAAQRRVVLADIEDQSGREHAHVELHDDEGSAFDPSECRDRPEEEGQNQVLPQEHLCELRAVVEKVTREADALLPGGHLRHVPHREQAPVGVVLFRDLARNILLRQGHPATQQPVGDEFLRHYGAREATPALGQVEVRADHEEQRAGDEDADDDIPNNHALVLLAVGRP
mmetsp:Transcript_30448/g.88277  ORF Transcript_30448/g.88277 Transcript_30448/m.88277 type:complete len:218 (+) Transcript_30448:1475-2128(+)